MGEWDAEMGAQLLFVTSDLYGFNPALYYLYNNWQLLVDYTDCPLLLQVLKNSFTERLLFIFTFRTINLEVIDPTSPNEFPGLWLNFNLTPTTKSIYYIDSWDQAQKEGTKHTRIKYRR